MEPKQPDCFAVSTRQGILLSPDANIIEAEAEWETIAPGASMELWVSPYPNAHLPAVLSIKYLNKEGQVIHSYTETGKHVGLGHTHLNHDLHSSVNVADALEFQVIIQNQHGEAQLQKKVSLKDLRANEDGSLDLGKARSVTAAMRALPEPTDEEDAQGGEATEENDQEEAYLTVVKTTTKRWCRLPAPTSTQSRPRKPISCRLELALSSVRDARWGSTAATHSASGSPSKATCGGGEVIEREFGSLPCKGMTSYLWAADIFEFSKHEDCVHCTPQHRWLKRLSKARRLPNDAAMFVGHRSPRADRKTDRRPLATWWTTRPMCIACSEKAEPC